MDQQLITIILVVTLSLSALGVIVVIAIAILGRRGKMGERIDRYAGLEGEGGLSASPRGESARPFSQFRYQLNTALDIISSEDLKLRLASAHWQVSDTEFILIRIGLAIIGFILGWVIPGIIYAGIALAVVAYMLPGIMLFRSIHQRQRKFQDQLLDILILVKGAVQSGYSLLQSLDVVISEMTPPSSEEFGRVVREVQLGLPLSQALINLANRMESDDLSLVVTAIIINTQVGGNLSTMLEAVTVTIRDRIQLLGEVRSLTSYARYAGYLLSALPFITGLIIFFLSPGYFIDSLDSIITQVIFVFAGISVLLGNIWLRRLAKIKV